MIESQTQTVVLRFFKNDNATMYVDAYDAVATVTYLSHDIIYVDRLKGSLSRKILRQWCQWLVDNKIAYLLATRSPLHTLLQSHEILPGLRCLNTDTLKEKFLKDST